jgi:hypothetical protein
MDDDMNNPRLRTVIMVYEVDNGWRYRVGLRDDGNYMTAREAFWAGNTWAENHSDAVKIDRGE